MQSSRNLFRLQLGMLVFLGTSGMSLDVPRNLQDFGFKRYFIEFRGVTSDDEACPPLEPSITISCTNAQLELAAQEGTNCVPDGNRLVCSATAAGRALVNCKATSLIDFSSGLGVSVRMDSPTEPFTCNNIELIAQGMQVAIVCPDDTTEGNVDFSKVLCDPLSSTLVNDGIPFCLASCAGATCDEGDIIPLRADVTTFPDECRWEGGGDPQPTPAALPQPTPPQPTPAQPTPTQPQPTPTQPTPNQPQPTPVQPTPTQPQPTPVQPTPTQPQPTPTQPQPTSAQPTPTQPSPTVSTPTVPPGIDPAPTPMQPPITEPTDPSPPETPDIFQLSPMNFEGCIEAQGDSEDSKLVLDECHSGNPSQQWQFDSFTGLIRFGDNKCMQAGRDKMPPEDGGKVRIFNCNENNDLQKFLWPSAMGSPISLMMYPEWCVVYRGTTNHPKDPIIVKKCEDLEKARRDGWKAN